MTPASDAAPVRRPLAEVRYSLPALLAELKDERATGAFAMEKLDQVEITKLFQQQSARRRAKHKK